jgi:hypothetical protein
MSVKRNEAGSVTIKSDNGVTIIRKIISTYVTQKDGFSQWLEHCAKIVTPCVHTF